MGNWRRVFLSGYCDPDEVEPLLKACKYSMDLTPDDEVDFHCLTMTDGLMGLGEWVDYKGVIDRRGNLAERDFSVQDVAEQFEKLVKVAPSLNLWCHCGDERESLLCVASIRVNKGKVEVQKPKIEEIPDIPEEQGFGNFINALFKAGKPSFGVVVTVKKKIRK